MNISTTTDLNTTSTEETTLGVSENSTSHAVTNFSSTTSDIFSTSVVSTADTQSVSSTILSENGIADISSTQADLTSSALTSSAEIITTTAQGVQTAYGSDTMAIIAGAAVGGTVFIVVVVILIYCCCRACRKKTKKDTSKYPEDPRVGPEGGSMPHPAKENSYSKQTSPGYTQQTPYFVDTGGKDSGYSGTIVHDTDPGIGTRPSTEGQFSLPRPTLVSSPSTNSGRKETFNEVSPSPSFTSNTASTWVEPHSNYSPQNLYQNVPDYPESSPMNVSVPKYGVQEERNVSGSKLRRDPSTEPPPKGGKYVKRKDEQIQRDKREASGKYVTNISKYQGSTYNRPEDFSLQLQPLSVNIDAHPQHQAVVHRQESPRRDISESTSPTRPADRPPQSPIRPTSPPPAVLPKTKLNKVPTSPVRKEPQTGVNELANNPVFNKRKKVIEEECKTIRIKPDDIYADTFSSPSSPSPFVKADPTTKEDEDPYWKIRESKIHLNQNAPLMNIIPHKEDIRARPESTMSETYDDVIPTHPQEEVYADTLPHDRNNMQEVYANQTSNDHGNTGDQDEYINVPYHHSGDTQDVYENTAPSAYHHDQEDYVNVPTGIHSIIRQESRQKQEEEAAKERADNSLSSTGRKRLPSIRLSMPPEVLSEAVDQLFDDAIAGSELDLSQATVTEGPSAAALSSQGTSVPPVLRRKTKIEESKEEKDDRDSWRISRSSFYDQIGADDAPPQLTQPAHLNASMVKKGMAFSDMNKPFNYMAPR